MGTRKKPFTKATLIPISAIVSNPSVKSKGIYAYHMLARLKANWAESVGDRMKELTFPYKFRNGTLYIAVTDSIWLSEISLLKNEILEKINSVNPEVADLHFKLTDHKINPPLNEEKSVNVKERALSERELRNIEETAGIIKDEKLRDIFRNAMSKSLKRE
jgi:hypothetical protein